MTPKLPLEARNFSIFDCMPVGVCLFTEQGTIVFWNSTLEDWSHINRQEIIGKNLYQQFPHLSKPRYKHRLQQIFNGGLPTIFSAQLHQYLIPCKLPNNQFRIQQTTVTSVPNFEEKGVYALMVIEDVTDLMMRIQDFRSMRDQALVEVKERQQTELILRHQTQELEQRFLELNHLREMNNLLQACLTIEEAYQVISHSIKLLFPNISGGLFILSEQSVQSVATWGENFNSKNEFNTQQCWALRRGKIQIYRQKQPLLKCQHLKDVDQEYCCVPLTAQGEALGLLYLTWQTAEDFSEAKYILTLTLTEQISLALGNIKLKAILQQQSIHDSLTGLYNRRYLDETLAQMIYRAERHQLFFGIIILEIANLWELNQTYDNDIGDFLLKNISELLNNELGQNDLAFRYRTQEIIIILPQTSPEDSRQKAEQIQTKVNHLNLKYKNHLVTAIKMIFAVVAFPEDGTTMEKLLQLAEITLQKAR